MRLRNMYRLTISRLWKKVSALPDVDSLISEEPPVPETNTAYALKTYVQQAEEIVGVLMGIHTSSDARLTAAIRLELLKKHSKLSWEKLSILPAQVEMMTKLLADRPKPPKVSAKTKAISQIFHANSPAQPEINVSHNDAIRENRDREVVRLFGLGKNKSQIAKLVGIHRRSVDRILDKLNA